MTNGLPSSPPCFARDGDDAYMGFADREEILAALNELLEAERAGARVTLHSIKAMVDPGMAALTKAVHRDEAHWCAELTRQIRRLGGTPSRRCGAFYGKAMAITEPEARLAFLNRGQQWVVRRLEALLPRVRDDALHAMLQRMQVGHVENIALVRDRNG